MERRGQAGMDGHGMAWLGKDRQEWINHPKEGIINRFMKLMEALKNLRSYSDIMEEYDAYMAETERMHGTFKRELGGKDASKTEVCDNRDNEPL